MFVPFKRARRRGTSALVPAIVPLHDRRPAMAAPGANLRQSSLRSFFPAGPSTAPSSAVASDYELLRQAKIRRNREFFRTLGIETSPPSASESKPKPKSKPPKPCPEPALPPRRSARKRPAPPPCLERSAPVEEYKAEEPDEEYVESAVFRYSASGGNAPPRADSSKLGSPDSAFKLVGKTLGDPRLAKIYTLDIVGLCPNRLLVAAGGHGGFISIFGTEVGEDGKDHDDEEGDCSQALMCWKSSRSWVSGVSFVKGKPTLLISSSNDGRLVVWDVGKQSSCLALGPLVVGELNTIHANGIFSMDHAVDGAIATASKDSSVALTRIAGDELVKEKRISGHHSGAIRGVCFRLVFHESLFSCVRTPIFIYFQYSFINVSLICLWKKHQGYNS